MKIQKFEDIIAWRKAKELAIACCRAFAKLDDFTFRNQVLGAALFIVNNIAEGFERRSNKELRRFLFIPKGSCGEVRSMLYIALELRYITLKEYDNLNGRCLEISKMLSGFAHKL